MQKISNLEEEDTHVGYWGAGVEYAVNIDVHLNEVERFTVDSTSVWLTRQDLVDMLEVVDAKIAGSDQCISNT